MAASSVPGLGIILLALYSLVVPDTLVRINALKQATSFAANVSASLFFVFSGHVVWEAAIVMAVGALLGGTLAGRVVRFINPTILRVVVVAIGLVVAVVYFVTDSPGDGRSPSGPLRPAAAVGGRDAALLAAGAGAVTRRRLGDGCATRGTGLYSQAHPGD